MNREAKIQGVNTDLFKLYENVQLLRICIFPFQLESLFHYSPHYFRWKAIAENYNSTKHLMTTWMSEKNQTERMNSTECAELWTLKSLKF